jgi:hypothetical protein
LCQVQIQHATFHQKFIKCSSRVWSCSHEYGDIPVLTITTVNVR